MGINFFDIVFPGTPETITSIVEGEAASLGISIMAIVILLVVFLLLSGSVAVAAVVIALVTKKNRDASVDMQKEYFEE